MRSFNPHTHAGCDFISISSVILNGSFNPHTHAGCDLSFSCIKLSDNVSIHTPTQGVTGVDPDLQKKGHVSIHTPTQGVTKFTLSTVSRL